MQIKLDQSKSIIVEKNIGIFISQLLKSSSNLSIEFAWIFIKKQLQKYEDKYFCKRIYFQIWGKPKAIKKVNISKGPAQTLLRMSISK